MAKQNNVFLYAIVEQKPVISIDRESKEPISAMVYVHVVRGVREVKDGKKYLKHDYPLIVSNDKKMIERMAKWKENDLVHIKGTINSKRIPKKSYCPYCKDEEDNSTVNIGKGLLLYVTPIYVDVMKSFETKEDAITELLHSREISNQAIVLGMLWNKPTYYKTKKGLIITQYQLITERKFRIKTDDPDTRSDWPWVKSYGEQAIEDRLRLQKGSLIIIDGFIQARNVKRKTKCSCCGNIYEWDDRTMEIVPFDTEYLQNYKTDQILEDEEGLKAEDLRQALFNHIIKDEFTEDMNTDDLGEDVTEAQ